MTVAYFRMEDGDKHPFVIRLEDDELVAHARQLVAGTTTSRPHVLGTIVSEPAAYNLGWSFHLAPASIGFFDLAAEVCDAASNYVEDHLAEVGSDFLPNAHWCPWGSRLTAEVTDTVAAVLSAGSLAPTVSLKDAFDMYQKQSDSVHKLWGYLSAVSIAVLGFTIGSDKINWTGPAYLFVALAYLMFAGSNLWVLRRSQQELGRISEGLRASARRTGPEAAKFVVTSVEADRVTLFHIASFAVVIVAIGFTWHQNCVRGTKCGSEAAPATAAASAPASGASASPASRPRP